MNDVSVFRLYVLRAMYLFIVVGLGFYVWPGVLNSQKHWELTQGMANCMLAAFFLTLHARAALSAADAARAPVGSGLEDALAHPRSLTAMDGRPCRRVDQALHLCHIHGRACLSRHSLGLCSCTLRESARRSLAITRGIEQEYHVHPPWGEVRRHIPMPCFLLLL